MTFAAMRHGFRQIGAAVPLRALRRYWLEASVGIEKEGPDNHQPALIVRKAQRVFGRRSMNRLQAEEVSHDSQRIRMSNVDVAGVGHGRIKPRPTTGYAIVIRVKETRVDVAADPSLV